MLDRGEDWSDLLFPPTDISTLKSPYQRRSVLLDSNFPTQFIMASKLIDLIDKYYEAKRPYTQSLLNTHTDPPDQTSSPGANTSTAESSEPEFSISPRIAKEEIMGVLRKLEATKLECAQREKESTAEASAKKKGKAPAGKK